MLARRLGRRNEDIVHAGGINTGVEMAAVDHLEQLPNLPEKTVVVLPLEMWGRKEHLTGKAEGWWDNLKPLDAVIVTAVTFPDEPDRLQGFGLPSLAEIEVDPTVALCTPTRCDREAVGWRQNGEKRKASTDEARLVQLLTDTFMAVYVPLDGSGWVSKQDL